MHNIQYIRHTLCYCLFAVFSCCNLSNTNAQEQYGFSKYFYYQGDTLRRADYTFTSLLYNPADQTILFPVTSRTYTSSYLTEWHKLSTFGITDLNNVESIQNNRYHENHTSSFAWEDNSHFYAAGSYFLQNDSFHTFFLQKMDNNFQRMWFTEIPQQYNFFSVKAIIPIDESNILVAPTMQRSNAYAPAYQATPPFANLMKFDTAGNLIWHKSIDSIHHNEVAHAIKANDNNIIFCGRTRGYGITDNGAAWVMKVDTAGNKLWHRTYDLPGFDMLLNIVATPDGNYIAAGMTEVNPEILDMPNTAGRIIKIDEDGNLIWDTVLNISPKAEEFHSLVLTPNGDVVAFGNTSKYYADDLYNYQVGSTREPEGWALRLNADGDVVWNRIFGHNALPHAHDYLYNAVALSDGGFVASGTTRAPDTFWHQGQQIFAYKQAAWLVKLDENGCVDTACSEILGTGIGSGPQIQYGLSLYPNPGKGKALLTTALPLPANTQLSITDIMGRTVWQTTVNPGTQQIPIDISRQPSGLYLIRLQADGQMFSLKYVLNE